VAEALRELVADVAASPRTVSASGMWELAAVGNTDGSMGVTASC
jgi:hypothetical protein